MEYCVLLFPTSHWAMRARQALEPDLALQVMPTPRQFGASCGICLRIEPHLAASARRLLEERLPGAPWDCRRLGVQREAAAALSESSERGRQP